MLLLVLLNFHLFSPKFPTVVSSHIYNTSFGCFMLLQYYFYFYYSWELLFRSPLPFSLHFHHLLLHVFHMFSCWAGRMEVNETAVSHEHVMIHGIHTIIISSVYDYSFRFLLFNSLPFYPSADILLSFFINYMYILLILIPILCVFKPFIVIVIYFL